MNSRQSKIHMEKNVVMNLCRLVFIFLSVGLHNTE